MATTALTWNGTDAQGQPLQWDAPGLTWDGTVPQPTKRMPQLHVLLSFASAPDHSLEETAQAVLAHLYGNALYPSPPVSQADLQSALTDFSTSIAAAAVGGPMDTADKVKKHDILVGLLRQLAADVQAKCGNDLANLLSSGFSAASHNRASVQLPAPVIQAIINGMSSQLILSIGPVANAKCYEVQYALIPSGGAPGAYQSAGLFTNSRAMTVGGLSPGGNYQFQVRAVGGSTGYSGWSDPVTHEPLKTKG